MTEARIIQMKIVKSSTRKTGCSKIIQPKLKSSFFKKDIHLLKIGTLIVALGIAGGTVLWSKSPAVNRLGTAQMISIQELHALAHLKGLPVQQFEDQSLIYPAPAQLTK
jgi:hypothetical protein